MIQRYNQQTKETCSICYEDISSEQKLPLTCQHTFCSDCITKYYQSSCGMCMSCGNCQVATHCPLCRTTINPNLLKSIFEIADACITKAQHFLPDTETHKAAVKAARYALTQFAQLARLMSSIVGEEEEIRIDLMETLRLYSYHSLNLELLLLEEQYEDVKVTFPPLINRLQELMNDPKYCCPLVLSVAEAEIKTGKANEAVIRLEKTYLRFQKQFTGKEQQSEYFPLMNKFHKLLIRAYYEAGNYKRGVEVGYAASGLDPYSDVFEYTAYSYRGLGQWDEAIAMMKRGSRYALPWMTNINRRYQQLTADLIAEAENAKQAKKI